MKVISKSILILIFLTIILLSYLSIVGIETDRFNDEICKIRIDGACFVKTNVPAKIVKEGIMKTPNMYWCSEAVIQKAKKVQPPSPSNRFGYGICTENGCVFE